MKKTIAIALAVFMAALSTLALAEPATYECDAYSISIPEGWVVPTADELFGYVEAAEDDIADAIETDEEAALYEAALVASSADNEMSFILIYDTADGNTAAEIMAGVLADYAEIFADTANFGDVQSAQVGELEFSYISYSLYGLSIAQYCAVANETAFQFTFTGLDDAAIEEILATFIPAA